MLYHFEVGFPPTVAIRFGILRLEYGNHCRRYSGLTLPPFINTNIAHVVEVETCEKGNTLKVLYRVPYDLHHDMLLAIIPDRSFVKTAWLNKKSDTHKTLRKERYDKP